MKLNLNFLGGLGFKTKNLRWGGVWIFSETAQLKCLNFCGQLFEEVWHVNYHKIIITVTVILLQSHHPCVW